LDELHTQMPDTYDKERIKQSIIGKLQRYNGRTLETATKQQIYNAVASTVRDYIMEKWTATRNKNKKKQRKTPLLPVHRIFARQKPIYKHAQHVRH